MPCLERTAATQKRPIVFMKECGPILSRSAHFLREARTPEFT